jgi:hypothetical protein
MRLRRCLARIASVRCGRLMSLSGTAGGRRSRILLHGTWALHLGGTRLAVAQAPNGASAIRYRQASVIPDLDVQAPGPRLPIRKLMSLPGRL